MNRMRIFGLCALLFLVCWPAALCLGDSGPEPFQGPADLRNQRPYQLLFFAFSPETARVLPKGRSSFSSQLDIANNLLIPYNTNGVVVHEDTETQRLDFKERLGLGNGLEMSASAPLMWRDAGVTDKIIEDYHHLIGMTAPVQDIAPGRRGVGAYHSEILLTRADGTTVVDAHPTFGIGDLQATLKRSLVSTPWVAYAVRVGVKAPTGSASQLVGSGGMDIGLDFDAQVALARRVALFGNVSYVSLSRDRDLDGLSVSRMRRGIVAIEYYASARSSWILQNDVSDAGVRTGNPFVDGDQATLSLAFKYRSSARTTWTYAFTENGNIVDYNVPWLINIAPDPTFSVGWEMTR